MKRIVRKNEKCDECRKHKAKYICSDCECIYCEKCAKEFDYICPAHEEPLLIEIEKR
jgi:hypothetical protein